MRYLRHLFLVLSFLGVALAASEPTPEVYVLEIKGAIGPATSDYVLRGITYAEEQGAKAVVLRMDTPGGLDSAMRDIIRKILASRVPVVSYVAPSGARAASAGTYILYASHVAAMAPATNLGAATPVQIGAPGTPTPSPAPSEDGDDAKTPQDGVGAEKDDAPAPQGDAMKRKIINDAVAYIRGLAQMRGRNIEWAEKAVREAASLSAGDALAINVIDLMAGSVTELLEKVDGTVVQLQSGGHTLKTAGVDFRVLEPDWRSRLLAVITDPNIAYLLMLLGVYGLFFELSNPGFVLPGVAGAILLLLALFAFQVLPVNYAGLALIALGISFMVAEAFMPSFGALGIGGVIAFVIGSIILMETDVEGYTISLVLIGSVALLSFAFFMAVVTLAVKARRRPVVSGGEQVIGALGEAVESFEGDGRIRLYGEIWHAHSEQPVKKGEKTRVISRKGLTLEVAPEEEPKPMKEDTP